MTADADTPRTVVGEDLVAGRRVRVEGVHIAHWELARFVLQKRRRRWRRGETLCQLEPRDGIPATVYEAAGVPPPERPRQAGATRFHVIAQVTPLERGSFGHMGLIEWRLHVEEWVEVTPLAPRRQRTRRRQTRPARTRTRRS